MDSLLTQVISLERPAIGGHWDESGRWIGGVTEHIQTSGRIQPFQSGRVTKLLPEGISEEDALFVITKDQVFISNTRLKRQADRLIDGENVYVAWNVKNFSRNTGELAELNHFECVFLLQDVVPAGG